MSVAKTKSDVEARMKKTIDALQNDLAKVRTGRAHTGFLDSVRVDYYGQMVDLSKVANVTLVDARTIGVSPWEKKLLGTIEKAIREANLGLNPSSQGDLIRVPMPVLTEERRREMSKVCKGDGEQAKVALRNHRRDGNEALKKLLKDKLIAEGEERKGLDDIQKLTDKYVADVDKMVAQKEAEIMTV